MAPPDPSRRNEQARQAIIAAAFDICVERGFAATTIEAIAARAGVGKTTIYRWWPSKAAILLEGVEIHRDASARFPDSGDIMADLATQTANAMGLFESDFGTVWRGLIAAAQSEEVAAQGVRRILRGSIDECVARLAKARDAGQIRQDLDLELVVELVYGPVYHTWLLRTRPVPPDFMRTVLAALEPALVPAADRA
ncbi:TetR-like C-terminal domain-containing protein [Streptomyces sp. NRRL S-87]|uniref:TetR-like C-terminal domain-containing protein n=1 Tax=Streptomyces sp. NRRL S-87 TaxID=1463920 RepID=UPI000562AFDF|nr:TetR-like C-terminal domain-containing protein [Streptomyces sp. NRRL S-87]